MRKRKIVVDEIEYIYSIGKENVRITNPDGTSYAAPFTIITNLSWDEIERGEWKKWFKITPKMIEEYIKNKDNPNWIRHGTKVTNGFESGTVTGFPSDTEVRVFFNSGPNMHNETVLLKSLRKI